MDVSGRKIIVTGAAGSFGQALSAGLTQRGAEVAGLDKDQAGLERVPGLKARIAVDLADAEAVARAVADAATQLGRIDVLVNNAGLIHSAPLVSLAGGDKAERVREWRRVLDANLTSTYLMAMHVAETMVRSRTKGVIVNISSIAAGGNAGQSAYAAAKAGVTALGITWAKELGPLGIRSVVVAPGFIDTPSTRAGLTEDRLKALAGQTPLRRLGQAEDVVRAVVTAIENDYTTGTVLHVDGGLTL